MNDASDFITVSDVPPSRKTNGSSFLEYLSTVSNSECTKRKLPFYYYIDTIFFIVITENNSLEDTVRAQYYSFVFSIF